MASSKPRKPPVYPPRPDASGAAGADTYLELLRPQTVQDPPIELSNELADMGLVKVQAPAANDRIDLSHQVRSGYRSLAPGTLADLLLEVLDRLLSE